MSKRKQTSVAPNKISKLSQGYKKNQSEGVLSFKKPNLTIANREHLEKSNISFTQNLVKSNHLSQKSSYE
jgi:hypothetical protein